MHGVLLPVPLSLPVLPGMGAGGHKSAFWGLLRHRFFGLCAHAHLPGTPLRPFLAVLLGFWAVMLLFSPSFGKRHRLLEDHGWFHATGSGLARPPMLALLLVGAALALVAAYGLAPYSTYERPQIVTDLRNGFADGFGIQEAMRGGVASNNNRVNLSSLGTPYLHGGNGLAGQIRLDSCPGRRRHLSRSHPTSKKTT